MVLPDSLTFSLESVSPHLRLSGVWPAPLGRCVYIHAVMPAGPTIRRAGGSAGSYPRHLGISASQASFLWLGLRAAGAVLRTVASCGEPNGAPAWLTTVV